MQGTKTFEENQYINTRRIDSDLHIWTYMATFLKFCVVSSVDNLEFHLTTQADFLRLRFAVGREHSVRVTVNCDKNALAPLTEH